MIYFWTDVTVAVSGAETKLANCDHCGEQYAYLLERTAKGVGHAPYMLFKTAAANRARRAAEKKLRKNLATAVDPVPCPGCILYPTAHAKLVQKQKLAGLQKCADVFGILVSLPLLVGTLAWQGMKLVRGIDPDFSANDLEIGLILLALILVPVFLQQFRRALVSRTDPNAEETAPYRRKLAVGRAWSLAAAPR